MTHTKPAYIVFYITSIVLLLTTIFLEKKYLIYIYPFPTLAILGIYVTENKKSLSFLYLLTLGITILGGMLLLLGLRKYVSEVSILFSFYYIFYMRLMYLKNRKQKRQKLLYYRLVLMVLPILYIYDRVMCLVYDEIRDTFIYFSILIIFVLVYIVLAIYYYLQNKNQSNLWMLIMSSNLGFSNIIITLNQLYMSETIFTIIAIFCYPLILYFSLRFMLEDDHTTTVKT